jgi:6-phosphogluconolactonase
MLAVFVLAFAQCAGAAEKYRVYFGTGGTVQGEGIFSSVLDLKTGQLTKAQLAIEAMRPGVIALHPEGTHLYAVGKPAGYRGPRSGSVSAYEIDRGSGALKLLNFEESQGQGPCYLEVDRGGRNILVCHYMSGNCGVLPLGEDGSVKPVSSVQQHAGSSEDPRRQSGPHPHAIVLDPTGRYAFVPDLGLDQVVVYKFNPAAGTLLPNDPPFAATQRGSGPRHFAFAPSGKFAYVNLELTSEVTAFRYDSEDGSLTEIQTLSTLPDDYDGRNWNAGIRVTPDGRFLYVSNRGHNSIAVFAIDGVAGTLTSIGHTTTGTDLPHTITLDPSGSCLIATDLRSSHVNVFRIDKESGKLTYASTIEIPGVNTVVMLPLE